MSAFTWIYLGIGEKVIRCNLRNTQNVSVIYKRIKWFFFNNNLFKELEL